MKSSGNGDLWEEDVELWLWRNLWRMLNAGLNNSILPKTKNLKFGKNQTILKKNRMFAIHLQ